ncbi:MAG: glycosyltransferase WbsX family protein [Bacillota bacterium]
MKIISFYLPQFHQIPENDKWWGKGFTEWTNTRKAKPLFPGHYQPREPFKNYYYDLTDPIARKWQAEIAKDYGIYGFCYYHYWFKGKRLLYKPLSEVLRTGEPDFPFCISWANESWSRNWDGQENNVLMPQDYGDESDWKEHFDYLLEAFLDKRYIRINNKPIFLIHCPVNIPRCSEMLSYWNKLAKKNGLGGIYFIETLTGRPFSNITDFNAYVYFEPMYTLRHGLSPKVRKKARIEALRKVFKKRNMKGFNPNFKMRLYDYELIWKKILERTVKHNNKPTFLGAFLDWDNSPRRGYDSNIVQGATPEKFGRFFKQQIEKAYKMDESEFLFINAWNEWGEGTYLEPDKKYGFRYLEQIKKALGR